MFKHVVFVFGCILLGWSGSAFALDRCSVGQRVMAPGGLATVVAIQNGGIGCTVRIDGRPSTVLDVYGAFMLDAVAPTGQTKAPEKKPSQTATPSTAALGSYQCYGGAAGNLKFVVLSGGRYANAQGKTGTMRMTGPHASIPGYTSFALLGGPLDGFFGAIMEGGRIGLSTKANSSFYNMTCDVPRRGQ